MDVQSRTFLKEIGLDKCVFCHSDVSQGKVLGCLHLACKSCALSNVSFGNTITCTRCQVEVRNPGHGYNVVDSLANLPIDDVEAAGDIPRAESKESSDRAGSTPENHPATTVTSALLQPPVITAVASPRVVFCEDEACQGRENPAASKCMECSLVLCEGHVYFHSRDEATSSHTLLSLNGEIDEKDAKCHLHCSNDLIKYCSTCDALVCEKCLAKDEHALHDVEEIQTAVEGFKVEFRDDLADLDDGEDVAELLVKKEVVVDGQLSKIAEEHTTLSAQISDDFEKLRSGLQKREAALKRFIDQKHWKLSKQLDRIKDETREQRGRLLTSKRLLTSLADKEFLRASTPIRTAIQQSVASAKRLVAVRTLDTEYHGFSDIVNNLGRLTSPNVDDSNSSNDNPIYCLQFDTMRKADGIKLTSCSQIARTTIKREKKKDSDGYFYVERLGIFGAGDHRSGVVRFRVELVSNAINHCVGVALLQSPLPPNWGFLGWAGHDGLVEGTKGKSLGLPWQPGDELLLTLDSTHNKLTAVHERTKETETIDVPAAPLSFKVLLCPEGSVRILPKIPV